MEALIKKELEKWVKFYSKIYKIEINPTKYKLPNFDCFLKNQNGHGVIVIPPNIVIRKTWNIASQLFRTMFWDGTIDSIDESFLEYDRAATNNGYVIIVDSVPWPASADEIFYKTTTLHEQIISHLEHFYRTGKHNDTENLVLCPSSRIYLDVPALLWDDQLVISWHGRNCRYNVCKVVKT